MVSGFIKSNIIRQLIVSKGMNAYLPATVFYLSEFCLIFAG